MRFALSLAFQPVDELVALAREADACGYDAVAVPDHVVEIETLATPYPYTDDGSRRWDHSADWPDPWVLIGALAQVTERIRFFTSVYVAALRSPYLVAKAVGTAAVLSGARSASAWAGVGRSSPCSVRTSRAAVGVPTSPSTCSSDSGGPAGPSRR